MSLKVPADVRSVVAGASGRGIQRSGRRMGKGNLKEEVPHGWDYTVVESMFWG